MEVILREDIRGLGYRNDTVTVKPGYGRNYLIPRGMAIIASSSNRKMIEENIRQAAHKAEKAVKDAKHLIDKMGDLSIDVKTKAGTTGKIFGSITSLQVSEILATTGFQIDRKKISFDKIKELGEYDVELDLHKEVKHKIKINVIAE